MKEKLKNISIAVALFMAGAYSLQEVSQQYNVPPNVIEEEAEKLLAKETLPESTLPIPTDSITDVEQKSTSSYDVAQTKKDIEFFETDGASTDIRYVYPDSKGIPTIGIGINLEDWMQKYRLKSLGYDIQKLLNKEQYLNQAHIDYLFDESFKDAEQFARQYFPNFAKLHPTAQGILVDMGYVLGVDALKGERGHPGFHKLNAELEKAIETGDYGPSAMEMRDSGWKRQTGRRGTMQSDKMENIGK